jgi:hypothetical protein
VEIMSDFQVSVVDDLEKYQKESTEGYIASYLLPIDFTDKDGNCVGVLHVHFDVIGYGVEGFEGGIDVSYQVIYFNDPEKENEFLEDDQAFIYIFTNFGEEIRNLIDVSWDVLDEHYEKGTPITIFEDK